MYLIDTDILISIFKGRADIQERVFRIGVSQCRMSAISEAELLVGAHKSGKQSEYNDIQTLKKIFMTIPISDPIIDRYARLRATLEAKGIRIEDMDLFIAATALANDYTLVTHNTRHFSRIPGLKLEDWIED